MRSMQTAGPKCAVLCPYHHVLLFGSGETMTCQICNLLVISISSTSLLNIKIAGCRSLQLAQIQGSPSSWQAVIKALVWMKVNTFRLCIEQMSDCDAPLSYLTERGGTESNLFCCFKNRTSKRQVTWFWDHLLLFLVTVFKSSHLLFWPHENPRKQQARTVESGKGTYRGSHSHSPTVGYHIRVWANPCFNLHHRCTKHCIRCKGWKHRIVFTTCWNLSFTHIMAKALWNKGWF